MTCRTFFYIWVWILEGLEKKGRSICLSLSFKEQRMVRDHPLFPLVASISQRKISERKTDVVRDMDIREILWDSREDFVPKKQTWEITNWQIMSRRISKKLRVCLKQALWVLIDRLLLAAVKSRSNAEERRVPRKDLSRTGQGTESKELMKEMENKEKYKRFGVCSASWSCCRNNGGMNFLQNFEVGNDSDDLWRQHNSLWTKTYGE